MFWFKTEVIFLYHCKRKKVVEKEFVTINNSLNFVSKKKSNFLLVFETKKNKYFVRL